VKLEGMINRQKYTTVDVLKIKKCEV